MSAVPPPETPSRSAVERVKESSNRLRGGLAEELADPAPKFSPDNTVVLKFHGIYQQDDRDVRSKGVEHICMVRVSIPGGVLTAEQYLAMDEVCDVVANGTLRVTTRQGIQFHFVHKGDLKLLLATLNRQLLTTLAACGDVVRNVASCPAPDASRHRAEIRSHVERVARHFKPKSGAYYDLWLDGERAVTASTADDEPFYGVAYLPRKFKIGFAYPDDNCIDVFTNDLGIVPVVEGNELVAFTLLVGGGMGRSHTDPTTFPRMATPLATVAPDELLEVSEAVVSVHRDHGNRADRDHARLKYLVEEWGIERFRREVEAVLGRRLRDPEPVSFAHASDHLGWHDQGDGRWYLGVKVENGRIVDRGHTRVRSALRAVARTVPVGVRLTSREDVLLTDVAEADRAEVDQILRDHGVVPAQAWVPLLRNSFACPALPTCGLALTESERALPGVLDQLHADLVELGLDGLDAHVRMTGCPNGCARPYTAEIGLVGRGKRSYDIHLGGEPVGIRLNRVFAENVPRDSLVEVLRPVLTHYRDHRHDGEGLGDFCHRVGVDRLRADLGNESWVRTRRREAADVAAAASVG